MRVEQVTMSVGCGPFLMNATIRCHLSQCPESEVATELKKSYVDDFPSGSDTDRVLLRCFRSHMRFWERQEWNCPAQAAHLCLLRSFRGASRMWPPDDVMKVLGVTWRKEDVFFFTVEKLPAVIVRTNRVVLVCCYGSMTLWVFDAI